MAQNVTKAHLRAAMVRAGKCMLDGAVGRKGGGEEVFLAVGGRNRRQTRHRRGHDQQRLPPLYPPFLALLRIKLGGGGEPSIQL